MSRIVREIVEYARPGAVIRSVRRLHGGLSATTHLVRLAEPPDLVVRRFESEWHLGDGTAALVEAHCLTRLAGTDVSAPALVWTDPTGEQFGMAVLVATRMPGRGRARVDVNGWIDGIAHQLAALHRLDPTDADRSVLPADPGPERSWLASSPPDDVGPAGRSVWSPLMDLFAAYEPGPDRLVHGDYHPGNVLNQRGVVTAVIDWEAAMIGPAAYDVGYCQMDLVLAHGVTAGDVFLDAYVRHAGELPPHLQLFQLVAVIRAEPQLADWMTSWHAQGLAELTPGQVEHRLAQFAETVLHSLDG